MVNPCKANQSKQHLTPGMYHLNRKGMNGNQLTDRKMQEKMVIMQCNKHSSSVTVVSLGKHCGKGSFIEG